MLSICDEEPYKPNYLKEYEEYEDHEPVMYFNNNNNNEKEYFYNVEKTDNPYIVRYIKTTIEKVSDNFKILNQDAVARFPDAIDYIREDDRYSNITGAVVIDVDFLKDTLHSYKKQLLENKRKVIIDIHLVKYAKEDSNCFMYNVREYAKNYGLSVGKDGKIGIKKVNKPKPLKTAINKSQIDIILKNMLSSYLIINLGFYIKMTKRTNCLYRYIKAVKALCPNTSYDDLITNEYYRNEEFKECENLWNNPELAITKPKTANKRKKNDQE